MTTMTKKTRSWIGGLLGVGVLVAVGWGAMPFGVGAQSVPPNWLLFNNFECEVKCTLPIENGKCCVKKKPIIVRPSPR